MQATTQEIVEKYEIFSESDKFMYTEIFFRQRGKLYYTRSEVRICEIDSVIPVFDINARNVFFITPDAYQAEWLDGITKYENAESLPPDVFMKTARLVDYDPTGAHSMASGVQPEVKILEKIKADKDGRLDNSGENIVEYYGCAQSSDGRFITGICLKRYPRSLRDIFHAKKRRLTDLEAKNPLSIDLKDVAEYTLPTSPEKILEGLIKGLQYLHGLGLIHNDINPANIMFDKDGRPIIIDFNISLWKGEKVFGGTFGWMDERRNSPTTAKEGIDIRAFYRVAIFMHKNFPSDGLELPPDYDGVDDDFTLIKQWLTEQFEWAKPWLAKEGSQVDLLNHDNVKD